MRICFRQRVVGFAAAALTFGFMGSVQAATLNVEMSNPDLLGLVQSVHLQMVDEVGDGCWTNINEVRAQAQAILAAAQINVAQVEVPDSATHPALVISASGQRVEGGYCIVQTEARLSFVTMSRFAHGTADGNVTIVNYNSLSIMNRTTVAVVSNENVDAEVLNWVGQVVTAWSNEILARRQAENMPALRQRMGLSN